MIRNVVILGAQWGDEGKGKIVDLLTKHVKYVVRYQGGNNAGHTIVVDQKKIILHAVPSGILYNHVINIIAGGAVISPTALMKELKLLKKLGLFIDKRIFISELCPMILEYHIAMDIARETKIRKSCQLDQVIGTTRCGIGPVYEDKAARRALRISDLYYLSNLEHKLKDIVDYYNFQLVNYYHVQPVNYQLVLNNIMEVSSFLISMVADIPELLNFAYRRGEGIIFEGAQGSLLDIDYGTYPYVTASHTIAGGASVGSGIGPNCIDYILGVVKAYSTRVGLGPFPTEIFDNIGDILRLRGKEVGSTTGRARRVGWFDVVAVRHAIKVNALFSCCLTKLDVLDDLDELKICVAYRMKDGSIKRSFPLILEELNDLTPVYETLPGWLVKTEGITVFDQLPKESKNYIKRIEELIGIPIDIISTGPERLQNIFLRNLFKI